MQRVPWRFTQGTRSLFLTATCGQLIISSAGYNSAGVDKNAMLNQ